MTLRNIKLFKKNPCWCPEILMFKHQSLFYKTFLGEILVHKFIRGKIQKASELPSVLHSFEMVDRSHLFLTRFYRWMRRIPFTEHKNNEKILRNIERRRLTQVRFLGHMTKEGLENLTFRGHDEGKIRKRGSVYPY